MPLRFSSRCTPLPHHPTRSKRFDLNASPKRDGSEANWSKRTPLGRCPLIRHGQGEKEALGSRDRLIGPNKLWGSEGSGVGEATASNQASHWLSVICSQMSSQFSPQRRDDQIGVIYVGISGRFFPFTARAGWGSPGPRWGGGLEFRGPAFGAQSHSNRNPAG